MKTIENINTIVNEDTVNAAVEAVEAIPVKAINWRKLGKVGGAIGAAVGIGVGTVAFIKHCKAKKAEKEAAANGIDNVKVAERDFVEKDSEEE